MTRTDTKSTQRDQHGLKWPRKAPTRGWNAKEGFDKERILLIEQK